MNCSGKLPLIVESSFAIFRRCSSKAQHWSLYLTYKFEKLTLAELRHLAKMEGPEELSEAYAESFEWLFYDDSLPFKRFLSPPKSDHPAFSSSGGGGTTLDRGTSIGTGLTRRRRAFNV
jgi:hypothetical protein